MIKRFGQRATIEYKEAVNATVRYGYNIAPQATPAGRSKRLQKSWKHKIHGLSGELYNTSNYATLVDGGWKRTRPIYPVKAKVLVFATKGFKGSGDPSTKTLYTKYAKAMKALKGKKLSQSEKSQIATAKSGVVVTKSVKSPASFKGHGFITKNIYPKMVSRFKQEMTKANQRIIA
jgi:hypothetical protein